MSGYRLFGRVDQFIPVIGVFIVCRVAIATINNISETSLLEQPGLNQTQNLNRGECRFLCFN